MAPLLRSALTRSSLRQLSPSYFTSSSRSTLLAKPRATRSLFGGPAAPKPAGYKPFYKQHPYWFALAVSPFVITGSLGITLLVLLGYDASTYHHTNAEKVPVCPIALHPVRGGKKNLKIASVLVDDTDANKVKSSGKEKQRLVIVGGGWGVRSVPLPWSDHPNKRRDALAALSSDLCGLANPPSIQSVGILKHLDPDLWHVTVVAPDNYFLFHPLLRASSLLATCVLPADLGPSLVRTASATVGTVEVRSLVEPLRKIIARVSGHFLQGRSACCSYAVRRILTSISISAVDVDFSERLLEVGCLGDEENFYLPYDKLVIACGSVNSTHGVPGLENCFQLKTVQDAQAIRRRVMDNLEKAALPSTEQEERRRLLNFVVCGGGPTGVEFASELWEMVNEDVTAYMPKLLRDEVKVHIIQSRDHILNTYAEKISQYAEELERVRDLADFKARFRNNDIDMILNARVKEVTPDKVIYTTKDKETGKTTEHEVDSGFVLWSTGIAMNPFTQRIASLLPNQYHKHALEVDSHLRVIGAPLGTVYALGDCATIETRLVDHLLEFVERSDENKDGRIDSKEFEKMMGFVKRKFPASQKQLGKIYDVFDRYKRSDGTLGLNELADMFLEISKKITNLPATAQVADQEGTYLGKKFTKLAKSHQDHVALDNGIYDDPDDLLYHPFNYRHMGSLAYIGNSAVFDIESFSFAGGLAAMYLWRSVYLSEAVSLRTRCLLLLDWIKRGTFGRDLSRF
ncbi:SPOSA6832_02052 [Sporobolomyces salmonicolor]|uniref:SPOSA6832_02052-mRNA-1:cds n=1 Tax=Sporidiobolus salmonicolor TaxID=5005 RepID=A0A0D6ELF2_SPOSA|nr:SPOSA6832_02052 [Sporobolomyces salmonicolor]